MDSADRMFKALRGDLLRELQGSILPYWMTHVPDQRSGGFHGRIDADNRVHPDAPRGGILNARILWTFSAAHRVLGDPAYLAMADRAYAYFIEHFIDPEHAGVYWTVNADGEPLDTKKHTYTQAFAIYALSEYVRARRAAAERVNGTSASTDVNGSASAGVGRNGHTQNGAGPVAEPALEQAVRLFRVLQDHAIDRSHGGYLEAFDRAWSPLDDVRLSPGDARAAKSFNTHLHLLEAFTNLLRVWPDPELARQIRSLVELHLQTIYDARTHHFHPFFDADWTVRATPYSFGHDIEAAWLMADAARLLQDSGACAPGSAAERSALRAAVDALVVDVADVTVTEGVDAVHHGLFYLGQGMPGRNGSGPRHRLVDSDKHWWVQAEALVGLLYAHRLAPKRAYGEAATGIWRFIQEKFKVPGLGEWRFRVDREGVPYAQEDLVSVWKCPYHNSRAALQYIELISEEARERIDADGAAADSELTLSRDNGS